MAETRPGLRGPGPAVVGDAVAGDPHERVTFRSPRAWVSAAAAYPGAITNSGAGRCGLSAWGRWLWESVVLVWWLVFDAGQDSAAQFGRAAGTGRAGHGDHRVVAGRGPRIGAASELSSRILPVTDAEVGLEHFAGLPTDAAVILFRAIEVAYAQIDPSTGRGQAEADGAGVVVHVRRGSDPIGP
jgi:hypothetical protein